jgi:hypothetical protein
MSEEELKRLRMLWGAAVPIDSKDEEIVDELVARKMNSMKTDHIKTKPSEEDDIIPATRRVPFVEVRMIVHKDYCRSCFRDIVGPDRTYPLQCQALVSRIQESEMTDGKEAVLLYSDGTSRVEICSELRRNWRLAQNFDQSKDYTGNWWKLGANPVAEVKGERVAERVKMRPLWHKEPCWECGQEGFATRTQSTPENEPYYCSECESRKKYSDACDEKYLTLRKRVMEAVAEIRQTGRTVPALELYEELANEVAKEKTSEDDGIRQRVIEAINIAIGTEKYDSIPMGIEALINLRSELQTELDRANNLAASRKSQSRKSSVGSGTKNESTNWFEFCKIVTRALIRERELLSYQLCPDLVGKDRLREILKEKFDPRGPVEGLEQKVSMFLDVVPDYTDSELISAIFCCPQDAAEKEILKSGKSLKSRKR